MTAAIIITALIWAVHFGGVYSVRNEPGDVRMITTFTFIFAVVATIIVWLVYWIF